MVMDAEPFDLAAIDFNLIVGCWYWELAENMAQVAIIYRDEKARAVLVTCITDKDGESIDIPWSMHPIRHHDHYKAIESVRFVQKMMLRDLAGSKAWELMRGGRTGEEYLEALCDMPGIRIVQEVRQS